MSVRVYIVLLGVCVLVATPVVVGAEQRVIAQDRAALRPSSGIAPSSLASEAPTVPGDDDAPTRDGFLSSSPIVKEPEVTRQRPEREHLLWARWINEVKRALRLSIVE